MTNSIDIMNYAPLVAPGLSGPEYAAEEFQIMLRTTFKSMAAGGVVATPWGRKVPIDGNVEIDTTIDIPNALAQLDEASCEITVLACLRCGPTTSTTA